MGRSWSVALEFFANGSITIGDTETTEREAGFDFDTNGLTPGR